MKDTFIKDGFISKPRRSLYADAIQSIHEIKEKGGDILSIGCVHNRSDGTFTITIKWK
jgi:hypothetical protein